MIKTASRFYDLQRQHKPVLDAQKVPKNGQEFIIFHDKFGYKEISCILNWKNGYLDAPDGNAAVQFEDAHVEYWKDGVLSNDSVDETGNLLPAVIANYGEILEYWVNGRKVTQQQ